MPRPSISHYEELAAAIIAQAVMDLHDIRPLFLAISDAKYMDKTDKSIVKMHNEVMSFFTSNYFKTLSVMEAEDLIRLSQEDMLRRNPIPYIPTKMTKKGR